MSYRKNIFCVVFGKNSGPNKVAAGGDFKESDVFKGAAKVETTCWPIHGMLVNLCFFFVMNIFVLKTNDFQFLKS